MRRLLAFLPLLMLACSNDLVSVKAEHLCGSESQPCNLTVQAPNALAQATVKVDGKDTASLMPKTHPLLRIAGIHHSQSTIARSHLPAGKHVIRVEKEGYAPIERVVNVGGLVEPGVELEICEKDLRRAL